MSGKIKVLAIASVFIAGLAVMLLIGPAQAAKSSSALSLTASFEDLWYDEGGNVHPYSLQNDIPGAFYVDTPDMKVGKKTIKSGVEVKYYPPSGLYKNGRFTMTIDLSGSLQRFVCLNFLEPSTDPAYENESHFTGLHVDPLWGSTGTLFTSKISFLSWGPLKADEAGILRWDTDTSLDMDKMQTAESKYISLKIEFNPQGEFIDRTYYLGDLAGVNVYFGAAELYCVEAGAEWEIRPFAETFTYDQDHFWRLLHTDVQIDWMTTIKLRSWRMPFVLRIWK